MRGWGVLLFVGEGLVSVTGAGVEEVVIVGGDEAGGGGMRGWKSKMDVELWVRRWPLRWWVVV